MGRHDFLYRNHDLSSRAIIVYLYLEDRANAKGECWPSLKTMSKDLKLSVSTIRRAIRDLTAENLIETKQRYRTNGGKAVCVIQLKKNKHRLSERR